MSVFLQPIYTQTVGTNNPTSITFNNIPQTFTDLKLVMSVRDTKSGATNYLQYMNLNGDGATNYSLTMAASDSSTVYPARTTSTPGWYYQTYSVSAGATSNTFSSNEIYIPNYTTSNFKQVLFDGVTETNGTPVDLRLSAGLWRVTSPITTIAFGFENSLVQYSTFSLYGITRG